MAYMGAAAYAKHRGITRAAVYKALSEGRIHWGPEGNLDPEVADKEWEANTVHTHHARDKPPKVTTPTKDIGYEGIPPINVSQARKEFFAAGKAELEFQKASGLLVVKADVVKEVEGMSRRVRDRMLNIGHSLADELASMIDAEEIERLIDREVQSALTELSYV